MASGTRGQIDIDYNRFFYATMCHVCKRSGDDVSLKRCSGCKLISYCGPHHQRQHWAQHKLLCKTVRNVQKDSLEKLEITSDNWNHTKIALMKAVEKKKRSLELYERQMFLFPKECAVCHERNIESLVDCQNCAISFCKDHKDDIAHKDACISLELCLRVSLSITNKRQNINKYLKMLLEHSSNMETFKMFQDMHDFIDDYENIQELSRISYNILAAHLSEHLTRPLTLLHAMEALDYVPKRKELVIHVLAATFIEEYTLHMWEILLHLIPETEVSLMIVMIGTELCQNYESFSLSVCDNCLSQGKKISFEFHYGLYEDYVHSPSFVKPDFVVGFNANIQAEDDDIFTAEIKELSLQMLAKQNCPFLLTHYTQEKLEKQANKINIILNRKVDYVHCKKNPYASLRPCRCIIGRELVFFNNNFVAIYRSLCS